MWRTAQSNLIDLGFAYGVPDGNPLCPTNERTPVETRHARRATSAIIWDSLIASRYELVMLVSA